MPADHTKIQKYSAAKTDDKMSNLNPDIKTDGQLQRDSIHFAANCQENLADACSPVIPNDESPSNVNTARHTALRKESLPGENLPPIGAAAFYQPVDKAP